MHPRWPFLVSSLLMFGCGGPAALEPTTPPSPFTFTHVTVIDATGAAPLPGTTVAIGDGRITALGKSAQVPIPPGATVVDGTGKFLIPGLWDMHVHTGWDRHFTVPLMIANGVIGVREMFGKDLTKIHRLRDAIARGELIGPRIVTAGPIVDGPNPPWPGSTIVTTEAEARRAVTDQQAQGADFVKVYSGLSRAAYFAIAAESHRRGIPFAGHVPGLVTVEEASDSGQRSIEHLTGMLEAASTRADELSKQRIDSAAVPGAGVRVYFRQQRALVETFSEEKAARLFERLRANGTWQVPTLTVARNASNIRDPALRSNPDLRYVPSTLQAMWGLVRRMAGSDTSAAKAEIDRKIYERQLWIVGAMFRAEVPILAGTDMPNPYTIPGFSLHTELQLLVKAGLTPMAALQAATRNRAQFLGGLDSMGTVENHKVADRSSSRPVRWMTSRIPDGLPRSSSGDGSCRGPSLMPSSRRRPRAVGAQ